MSILDTMTPIISAPWCDAQGTPLSIRPLPGLRPQAVQGLECTDPGTINPALKELIATCCGLAGTDLGNIDFTGCFFPPEPCAVFQPCLTLAIDDAGRRWIAEVGGNQLPGPIWCIFPDPEVAVYVSDDLAGFIATLRDRTCRGQMLEWLLDLNVQARAVWSQRRALALRPYQAHELDEAIRGWLAALPFDAYVYDLRSPTAARGWPYGVAGPSGRLYRCGLLPVFAVAGSPTEGWRARDPEAINTGPRYGATVVALMPRRRWPRTRAVSGRPSPAAAPPLDGWCARSVQSGASGLRQCA